MKKFVDKLPEFGNEIPIAVADTATYTGTDYYEIALVEYEQQMHTDLPIKTKLRGYVQLASGTTAFPLGNNYFGVTAPSYLGPAIVATKDTPVRILFRNLLPTGEAGCLLYTSPSPRDRS